MANFEPQAILSLFAFGGERKVRTPQSSIAGNTRPPFSERTSATESKYSSAVVKSGKLYAVQRQV